MTALTTRRPQLAQAAAALAAEWPGVRVSDEREEADG